MTGNGEHQKPKPPIYSLSALPGYADDGWPEKQTDISFILKKDEWSMSDVLSLVDENQAKVREVMLSSINSAKLRYSRSVLGNFGIEKYFFKPAVVLDWLKAKEIDVLEQVLQWQKASSKTQPEGGEDKQSNARTRKDNLSRAIDSAIVKLGKKPSLDELWKYFQDDRDETGFIEDFTDTHITWKDSRGKLHDTQKESIANRLSRVNS